MTAAGTATDTRELLLRTAETILDEAGLGALGLREIARRAGLSHNAPLRHFGSLAELRTAVATRGFAEFADRTAAAVEPRAGDSIVERGVRIATSYVRFASDHPGLFALMWRPDLVDADAHFIREAARAFTVLHDFVGEAQAAGHRADLDRSTFAALVWSMTHGISQLWPHGSITRPSGVQSLDDLVRDGVIVILGPQQQRTQPGTTSEQEQP